MIFVSLRKTKKWGGQAKYKTGEGFIYLLKMIEWNNPLEDIWKFNDVFWYIYHHECLHLLLKQMGIKGFRNEEIIFQLAQRLEILHSPMIIHVEDLK